MGVRASRRKFLRRLATGLPALAAGGALATVGLTAKKGSNGSQFPGDPAIWRSRFLEQARAERGATAVVDTIDAPVRPTDVPMVMDVSRGPIAVASPAADVLTTPSDLVLMQKELQRA